MDDRRGSLPAPPLAHELASTSLRTPEDPLSFAAGDANLYRYVFNAPTVFTDPSGQVFFVPFVIGAVVLTGAAFGLGYAADRYDEASRLLARPPTPENEAELLRGYNQARWSEAVSWVAIWTGGTFIVSPVVGYGAGWLAGTGKVGAIVVTTSGLALTADAGYDAYTIYRDWNLMADNAERFERVGTLLGPLGVGGYCGWRGFVYAHRTQAPIPIASPEPSPRTPVGSKHLPLGDGILGTNQPTVIYGRPYTGHAIDRMQQNGIYPIVVENTIKHGQFWGPGNTCGTVLLYDPINDIRVVLDINTGRVVTVGYGRP